MVVSSGLTRRGFMGMVGRGTAGALLFGGLGCLYERAARGEPTEGAGFGPLVPQLPTNQTELAGSPVGNVLRVSPVLSLPEAFSYQALSITGDVMNDGTRVAPGHDGMACFPGRGGRTILVRNHELTTSGFAVEGPAARTYDPAAKGGTTTLVFSRDGRLERHYVSLAGTLRNCAGGLTPWGTWISCEEDVDTPEIDASLTQRHGYNFEVPARSRGAVRPIPLVAMGRFNHEAVATDAVTGIVYQTEDRGDSCLYRFRPRRYGRLRLGGVLEALVVRDMPSVDTGSGFLALKGQPLPVEWVELEDVDPVDDTLRFEAQSKGAAIFRRGEGAWYHDGLIYFVCTTGGDAGDGQVWAHDPVAETLTLVVESTDAAVLDNPDNITVAPDGTLYLCEDGDGPDLVRGVTPSGEIFPFASYSLDGSEFAGACFTPDGTRMFVNNQGLGITFCIDGPFLG